jgi:hypothetical protein
MSRTREVARRAQHVGKIPAQFRERDLATAVRTADRIDYWVRRRVMEYWLCSNESDFVPDERWPADRQTNPSSHPRETDSAPHGVRPSRTNRSRERKIIPPPATSVLLSIGQCLKVQYDDAAAPIPPHITALAEQLETQR